MTEKKGRGPRKSDRPGAAVAAELKEKRDAFLQTFFKRGAELTDELVADNRRLREQIAKLEEENTELKTQVASDRAMRDLLKKIQSLETEKSRLLSTVHEQEEITGRITNRFAEVESELESFANLYVASFQLHLSLRLRTVMRHIRELLVQLVGARSLAVYFADDDARRLVPVVSEGVELAAVQLVPLQDGATADPVMAVIERTFLTGVPHIAEGDVTTPPAACIPLAVEDRNVGVIVIYALLEQKKRFVTVDRELFKLLGAHAGATIVAAYLYTEGDGRLPSAETLRAMCA
ncbi:MAG TPA: GAF domain-containing protein [Polyangiaceae bacterium]|jgi:GAF domain-containing protein